MEYGGRDLKSVMLSVVNGTDMNESHVVTIIYNLLCGLKQIHKSGIIHRDIKPANIVMSDNCSIKICDFGLSRSIKKGTYQRLREQTINDEEATN